MMTGTAQDFSQHRLYTRQFFQIFVAVGFFMTGVALQFHFGQYVEYLGHGVDTLGWVLSVGMIGTLLIRLHIGRWIDRFGCRPTWLAGTLLFAATVGCVQFATDVWLLVTLRLLSTVAMSAVMTTVPVLAAQIAPPQRRAECIGSIGLAGLLGIVIGPTLGDWIFAGTTDSIVPYRVFFSLSATCSVLAGLVMAHLAVPLSQGLALPGVHAAKPSECGPPSQLRLIARHWPGTVLLVGFVFSMAFCLQMSFLERLAEARGFKDIKIFFLVYGPTAITLRIIFRRLPAQLGRTRTLVGGLFLLAAGLLCLVGIQSQSQLVLPAVLMGAGHCFVFPSMVDLAAERLPTEYRGTGTALILGAGDLGLLVGFVMLGEVVEAFGFDTALAILATAVVIGASVFAMAHRESLVGRNRITRPPKGTGTA